MANDIGIRVGIDGEKQFRDSLKGINSQLKNLNTELEASQKEFKDNADSQQALKAKTDILSRSIEATKQKVELLSKQYDAQSKKLTGLGEELDRVTSEFGANSKEAGKAQNAYNRQAAQVNNLGSQLNTARSDLSRFESQMQEAAAQSDKLTAGLKSAASGLDNFSKKTSKIGNTLTLGVTTPLLAAGTASFKFASDLNENLNKTEVAFEKNADDVVKWSETTLKQYGLAQSTALEMAATWGDMGTSMEIPLDSATEMSKTLVGLAADMASFKNISIDRAQTALNAVYTGETESLKELGVVMTQANLEAYAMSKGIEKNYQDMSEAEKVTLRYQYVLDKTKNSQGDFARTSDSAANQMRIAQESVKELAAEFGQKLLPVGTKVLNFANDLLDSFNNLDDGTQQLLIGIGATAAAAGPLIKGISGITSVSGKALRWISNLTSKIKGLGSTTDKSVSIVSNLTKSLGGGALGLFGVIAAGSTAWGIYKARQLEATNESFKAARQSIELRDAIKSVNDEIERSAKNRETSVTDIELEAEANKKLADRLFELSQKQNLTNGEKNTMAALVDQLNEKIPNLSLEIEKETGKLSLQKQEVYNLIEANKELMKAKAAEDFLQDIAKDMVTAQKNSYDLSKQLKELEKLRREAQDKVNKARESGTWSTEITTAQNEVKNLTLEIEKLKTQIQENDKTIQESQKEWDYYESLIDGTGNSIAKAAKDIVNSTPKINDAVKGAAETAVLILSKNASKMKNVGEEYGDQFADGFKAALQIAKIANTVASLIPSLSTQSNGTYSQPVAQSTARAVSMLSSLPTLEKASYGISDYSPMALAANQSAYETGKQVAYAVERRINANINPERQQVVVKMADTGAAGTTLNQTNNFYSPEALSPAETARLNRNNVRSTIRALGG